MRRQSNRDTSPAPEYGWEEIERVTDTDTEIKVSIPSGYKKIGFWIVGGGSGGNGDYLTANWPGQGGNGGQANDYIIKRSDDTATVFVGSGGRGGTQKQITGNAKEGNASRVLYGGVTYLANGGTINKTKNPNTKQENSGLGGIAISGTISDYNTPGTASYYKMHGKAGEGDSFDSSLDNRNHVSGGDGRLNVFDSFDTVKYGAGGAGGVNAYNVTYSIWGSGGDTGGGEGGHGSNNSSNNKGIDASSYGSGGGGAAFSSSHTYSQGGAGYQGIVIIYGKK